MIAVEGQPSRLIAVIFQCSVIFEIRVAAVGRVILSRET
jgi:hypothetical protein